MNHNLTTVCVTGAAGYLASWVVKHLLEAGHTVHGTVRDKGRADKVKHLTEMAASYPDRLKLFEADLLKEGSFQDAVAGCTHVIHTASPFLLQGIKDGENQLIKPALEGTRNVLNTVNETPSVQRVVLTSSVVAMWIDNTEKSHYAQEIFDETAWNRNGSLDYQPYSYSKTVAEKEAWKMVEAQDRWDLVVINPGFVLGPSLSTRMDGATMQFMKQLADGTLSMGAPEFFFATVDVRDVSYAHLLAAFKPEAEGRHLTAGEVMTLPEMGRMLKEDFARYPLPTRQLPKWLFTLMAPVFGMSRENAKRNIGVSLKIDNSKSQSLGVSYRPIKETLVDQLNQMLESGLVLKK